MGGWAQAMLNDADGDREFVADVAEMFLASLPGSRDALAAALRARDARALAAAAHRLRGTAAHICAPTVATAAGAVEDAALAGRLDDTAYLTLQPCLDDLERDMRAFVLGTPSR